MNTPSKKVMIVEDDILLLLVQERLVQKFGYEVAGTACSGDAAYRMIQLHKPDIILMDINLEDNIKGTDVIEMIRRQGNQTPVIFLSGEKNPSQVHKARLFGCVDYLLKPFVPEQLERSLQKALDSIEQESLYAA